MFTENLALKKKAWQSNLDDFYYNGSDLVYLGADLAVDGRKQNLALNGRQCARSYTGQTAEWRGGLQKNPSIQSIFIQYMTDNRVWGSVSFFTKRVLLSYKKSNKSFDRVAEGLIHIFVRNLNMCYYIFVIHSQIVYFIILDQFNRKYDPIARCYIFKSLYFTFCKKDFKHLSHFLNK